MAFLSGMDGLTPDSTVKFLWLSVTVNSLSSSNGNEPGQNARWLARLNWPAASARLSRSAHCHWSV